MNKKGFTLIELIAVVVIMAIIALIATPNIVNMMDRGKKEDYVADAKEIITKATYMYKKESVSKSDKFTENTEYDGNTTYTIYMIYLKKIDGINDYTDPYGFDYNTTESYVKFKDPVSESETLKEREIEIYLTSNDQADPNNHECYILSATKENIGTDKVQQGTFSGGKCSSSSQ